MTSTYADPSFSTGADVATALRRDPTFTVSLQLNGRPYQPEIEPWVTLLDLLRERADLIGVKKGCDHGQCGACTVLIDGQRINSCLKFAASVDGYCRPGLICSARALIAEGRAKTRDEVRELMSGNICRCGAYTNITDAIGAVMAQEGTAR